jgi:site-specific recombinase XerD
MKFILNQRGRDIPIDEVSYPVIADFFQSISTYHVKNNETKKMSVNSQKRKRIVLNRFFKFCTDKHLCDSNLSGFIDPIRHKKSAQPKDVLKPEEIQQIFTILNEEIQQAAQNAGQSKKGLHQLYVKLRNRLLIHILLFTGCRAQEAVSLKKSNIKMTTNTIGIVAKGNKYNEVPIHMNLKYAFFEYEDGLRTLEGAGYWLSQSEWMFPSIRNANKHLSTRTLHDLMIDLSRHTGRKIHAHLFRHTFASYSIASGMNVRTLASIISHSSPAITLSIYTHEIEAQQKQEEMKKLYFQV